MEVSRSGGLTAKFNQLQSVIYQQRLRDVNGTNITNLIVYKTFPQKTGQIQLTNTLRGTARATVREREPERERKRLRFCNGVSNFIILHCPLNTSKTSSQFSSSDRSSISISINSISSSSSSNPLFDQECVSHHTEHPKSPYRAIFLQCHRDLVRALWLQSIGIDHQFLHILVLSQQS